MRCRSCKTDVTPVAPKTMAKIVTVGFWVAAMAISTIFSLLLGLNIVLVPVAVAIGLAVGTSARRASTWSCPQCKEEMAAPAVVPTGSSGARPSTTRPLVPATATT